jgi:hypothetical protein
VRLDLTEELVGRMVREYRYTRAGLMVDTEAESQRECLERIENYLQNKEE